MDGLTRKWLTTAAIGFPLMRGTSRQVEDESIQHASPSPKSVRMRWRLRGI